MVNTRVPGWVWAVLVCAHLGALGWSVNNRSWNFTDTGRYIQAAENLRQYGQLFARPWTGNIPRGQAIQEFTIRPVGYPLVVWGLNGAGGWPVILLVFQNLLSLLNLGVVLDWWARAEKLKTVHWIWAVAGILTFPAQLIYANAVMSEMLLQTVVVVLVSMSLLFIKTRQKGYFAGAAGMVILALLLKPVFYPLAVVAVGLGILLAAWQRRLSLALIGVIPLAIVGLYMSWNEQRTGYFHFSSIAEINLLQYNAAGVVRQLEGPGAEEKWVDAVLQQANAQSDFGARQRLIRAQAVAMLWAHPMGYARQQVQGMAAFFTDPGRFDVSQFLGLPPLAGGGLLAQVRAGTLLRAVTNLPLPLLGGLAIVLLANIVRLVLAVRGFGRLSTSGPMLRYGRWVAVGLLLYVAILTGPLGAARFLMPVWPLLLGLALVGLKWGEMPLALGTGQVVAGHKKLREE